MIWFFLIACAVYLGVFQHRFPAKLVPTAWKTLGVMTGMMLLATSGILHTMPGLFLLPLAIAAGMFVGEKHLPKQQMSLAWQAIGCAAIVATIISCLTLLVTPVTVIGYPRNGYIVYDYTPHMVHQCGQLLWYAIGIGGGIAAIGRGRHLAQPATTTAAAEA